MKESKYLDLAQQPAATSDMDPEALRMYGHQVVDWIADYLTHVGEYPVLAQTAPGDIRHALPDKPPIKPESMETILADFERVIMPGITTGIHQVFWPISVLPARVLVFWVKYSQVRLTLTQCSGVHHRLQRNWSK